MFRAKTRLGQAGRLDKSGLGQGNAGAWLRQIKPTTVLADRVSAHAPRALTETKAAQATLPIEAPVREPHSQDFLAAEFS